MQLKSIGIVAAVGAAAVAIRTGVAAAQPDDGEGTPITGDALTKADGSQVDVQLDQNFIVVGSKTDGPGADNEPDGDGN